MSSTAVQHSVLGSYLPFTKLPMSDPFQNLVQDLSDELSSTSGTDISEVDHLRLQAIMERYTSNAAEWSQYALGDESRAYTRNLVDRGNGKSNLLILVWSPGKGSPIHDHANAHCVMKILHGRLRETLYEWPDQQLVDDGVKCPPVIKRDTIYTRDQVTYMSDDLGLHRVMNPDPTEFAVSLHLYTPPHAANHGCNIFDGKSGRASHVTGCPLFSEYGQRL